MTAKPSQTRMLISGDVMPHGRRQARRLLPRLRLVHRERGKRVWADEARLVVIAVSALGDAA